MFYITTYDDVMSINMSPLIPPFLERISRQAYSSGTDWARFVNDLQKEWYDDDIKTRSQGWDDLANGGFVESEKGRVQRRDRSMDMARSMFRLVLLDSALDSQIEQLGKEPVGGGQVDIENQIALLTAIRHKCVEHFLYLKGKDDLLSNILLEHDDALGHQWARTVWYERELDKLTGENTQSTREYPFERQKAKTSQRLGWMERLTAIGRKLFKCEVANDGTGTSGLTV